ncbi:MAG: restriction endonuclease subunit S [Bradymonadaceae bacterium]
MNQTLEEMAQAIFKSWFIDFDGHDDLVDSDIGPVPRGWEVGTLDQVPALVAGIASTDILIIRPHDATWRWFIFGHLYTDSMVAHATAASDGTKMPRTKWRDLCRYLIALPADPKIEEYDLLVSPMYSRIAVNIAESRTLAELRDTLLAKLISGELRVCDAEAVVSEAV